MPELPEVETIKTAIAHSIGECVIKDLIIRNKKLREPIPDDAPEKIIGSRILNHRRIAKYIVIDLDNGLSIVWHMGMSGKVKISDDKPEIPGKHDHLMIETDNGWITFNDARRFGLFTLVATEELTNSKFFNKVGLDPFDEKLDKIYLFNKLKNRKTPIKISLLDQSIITGIGNIYASESLFEAGILPTRESANITLKECAKIIESVRNILKRAIAAGGSTLRDYKKPDGSLGYFQNLHCVYNKTGQKCSSCTCDLNKTGGVQKIVQAGRSSFFCSTKQK